jgi:deubiquitinase DESI2
MADGDSGLPVILNVYDIANPSDPALIPNINSWMIMGGMGVFHSGVELLGREFCFGGHPTDATGVFEVTPRCAPDAKFRQAIPMGLCYLDPQSLDQLISNFSAHWAGNRYNLLTRNCNHFAGELCQALTGNAPPAWVNRLAWVGEKAKFLLPAGFDTPMAAPVTAAAAERESARARAPLDEREREDRERAEVEAVAAEVRAAAAAAGVLDSEDDSENNGVESDLYGRPYQI